MAEGMGEQIAKWNVNQAIEKILADWNIKDFQLFVTGENNFRYSVFPEYKAGRLNQPRPTWLEACKSHLVREWGAIQSDGCEADDMIGIEQYRALEHGEDTVVVSIDKDLLQLEGIHYRPEILRKGVLVKPGERKIVSPNDAKRFFYYQLLVGDSSDGVKGAAGIGPKKAEPILDSVVTGDYYNVVKDYFSCEDELEMNASVLFIWRQMNDNWKRVML